MASMGMGTGAGIRTGAGMGTGTRIKMGTRLRPVSVAGIEFDALIDETKTFSASVPVYPVEEGFPVSDSIILDPLSVQMTLYVSNTPVTWLYRHGSSNSRVRQICDMIENLWLSKQLVKIVTADAIYTNMGLTSISIKKSKEIGYAREISLTAQKVRVTALKTAEIPAYILKAGETQANVGRASTSVVSSDTASSDYAEESVSSGAGESGGGQTEKNSSAAKRGQSILYGVASGMGFI